VQQREAMLLEDSMHDRFRELLQSNTGLAAALQYSRSRPAINLLPLFDSLDEQQVAGLMKGSRTSFGSKVGWVWGMRACCAAWILRVPPQPLRAAQVSTHCHVCCNHPTHRSARPSTAA
jgi:hypothetical protein